jgi:L-lactate dehydrogenase complex protein LldE
VKGLTLVPLPRHDECCGFGGTFAVKNADVSTEMGADKVACVLETGAEICTAADNSCLMQIDGLLRRRGAPVRCVHLAEILASTGESATRDPATFDPATPRTREPAVFDPATPRPRDPAIP